MLQSVPEEGGWIPDMRGEPVRHQQGAELPAGVGDQDSNYKWKNTRDNSLKIVPCARSEQHKQKEKTPRPRVHQERDVYSFLLVPRGNASGEDLRGSQRSAFTLQ